MPSLLTRTTLRLATAAALALSWPALAAVNGLWSAANGDHLLLLQDDRTGATFSLQVPAALNGIQVWTGSGSAASISLQGVYSADDRLAATLDGSQLTGSITQGGQQQALSAQLALAWVANANAGVWQKATDANAYLVFCVLETANGRLGVQVDVTLDTVTRSYRYDIYTGVLTGSTFTGASLTGSGTTSRLVFGDGTLDGSTATVARPVQTTTFTASQLVRIGG